MGDWGLGGHGTAGNLSIGCWRAGKWRVLEGRDGGELKAKVVILYRL